MVLCLDSGAIMPAGSQWASSRTFLSGSTYESVDHNINLLYGVAMEFVDPTSIITGWVHAKGRPYPCRSE